MLLEVSITIIDEVGVLKFGVLDLDLLHLIVLVNSSQVSLVCVTTI